MIHGDKKVIKRNNKFYWNVEFEEEVECATEFNGSNCTSPPVHTYADNVKGPWCQECHDYLLSIMDHETGGWK